VLWLLLVGAVVVPMPQVARGGGRHTAIMVQEEMPLHDVKMLVLGTLKIIGIAGGISPR